MSFLKSTRALMAVLFLIAPVAIAAPVPDQLVSRAVTFGDTSIRATTATWYSASTEAGADAPSDPSSVYTCITPGTLSDYVAQAPIDEWVSFDNMWLINQPVILQTGTTADEANDIRQAIEEVSQESQVDARFILAVIMQESTGHIQVQCTGLDVNSDGIPDNCGLMQAPAGSQSYDAMVSTLGQYGAIKQMLLWGVYGTTPAASGNAQGIPGLLGYFNGVSWISNEFAGNPFAAARAYNKGTLSSDDLNAGGSPYASDVANRLLGWNGELAGCLKSAQVCGVRTAGECY